MQKSWNGLISGRKKPTYYCSKVRKYSSELQIMQIVEISLGNCAFYPLNVFTSWLASLSENVLYHGPSWLALVWFLTFFGQRHPLVYWRMSHLLFGLMVFKAGCIYEIEDHGSLLKLNWLAFIWLPFSPVLDIFLLLSTWEYSWYPVSGRVKESSKIAKNIVTDIYVHKETNIIC